MRFWSRSAVSLALVGLLSLPSSAGANELGEAASNDEKVVKLLADHPGAATALTVKQKSQIRKVLARGNQNFRCTGLSLPGQRESMYRVVRLRAQLVCDYAKSIDPSIKTTVKEKIVKGRNLNGRVRVVSN